MMRKTLKVMAFMAMMGFAIACDKENTAIEEPAGTQFHFTVEEPDGGPATKAVKYGWTNGDRIIVFFRQGSTGNFDSAANHQLVLRKTAFLGDWVIDRNPVQTISEDGQYAAFYYNTDSYAFTVEDSGATIKMKYNNTELLAQGWYADGVVPTYTVLKDGVHMTLSLTHPKDYIQVVVPGVSTADKTYLKIWSTEDLKVNTNVTQGIGTPLLRTEYRVSWSPLEYSTGVANDDGVAYYMTYLSSRDTASKYYFTLFKGSDIYVYTRTKDSSHTLSNGMAIKLPAFDGDSSNPVNWIKR